MSKIVSEKKLITLAVRFKKQKKQLVTYSGSFDVLHAGHVRSLKEARVQGDALAVLLNSDASVRLYKGSQRPIVPEDERAEMLAAFPFVDYIVMFDDITPVRLLGAIRPAVHCNGAEWGKNCVERDTVERHGGRIHLLRWKPGHSTTRIIEKIINSSRQSSPKAVFLDRDGTINHDPGYIYRIKNFSFLPGVIPALRRLSQTDFKIIIATNQSGIGMGYYTERDMHRLHRWMCRMLASKGVRIDGIYYCPHAPEDACACRKPEIGMFLAAANDFALSLGGSWFVGDKEKDVLAGRRANINTIKLGPKMSTHMKLLPRAYARDLAHAIAIILKASA